MEKTGLAAAGVAGGGRKRKWNRKLFVDGKCASRSGFTFLTLKLGRNVERNAAASLGVKCFPLISRVAGRHGDPPRVCFCVPGRLLRRCDIFIYLLNDSFCPTIVYSVGSLFIDFDLLLTHNCIKDEVLY